MLKNASIVFGTKCCFTISQINFKAYFNVPSPVQQLCCQFMSLYATKGVLIPGTLVCKIVQSGRLPIDCLFNKIYNEAVSPECGVVCSLKALKMHEI